MLMPNDTSIAATNTNKLLRWLQRSAGVFLNGLFKGNHMFASFKSATAASAALSTTAAVDAVSGVVQHDTPTPHTIKLDQLGVPATISVERSAANADDAAETTSATVVVAAEPVPTAPKLENLEQARISWERTELAASNKRLYSILSDAYSFYLGMKTNSDKDARKARADEMEQFIKTRAYTFMPSTHDMTRVVKCVFGVDRRRVSAYSIALREALRQAVTAVDLVTFIEQNGGVEQIRLGGTKALSVTKRAANAQQVVLGFDLGMLKFDPVLFAGNADWVDQQVVIVATYLPTGEFQANAVIKHSGAVNSALAAYYSQQQAKVRESAKAQRDADQAEANAAKAVDRAEKKQIKTEKQLATVAAERAQAVSKAALQAHAATLFETQAA
jgi:hypothetical protein